MSAQTNELRRNNTSGIPCIRLCTRRGYEVIDVTWFDGHRRWSTSYLLKTEGPVRAVSRAMAWRQTKVDVRYTMTPKQAWARIKKCASARPGL